MAGCKYTDCTIQEISIASLAGDWGRRTFFYRHTATRVTPIAADGSLVEGGTVGIDQVNPGDLAPEVQALVNAANAALWKTLDELLDTGEYGHGATWHAFGCADECDCVRKRTHIELPDGTKVPDPGQTIDGGLPPGSNAVPGEDQPLAVIEKRVNVPGHGLFLVTYEIRLFGTVRRFAGTCTPREQVPGTGQGAGRPGNDQRVGMDDRTRSRLLSPVALVIGGISLCCLVLACAALYYSYTGEIGRMLRIDDEPPVVATLEGDDPSIGTETVVEAGTNTLTPSPSATATDMLVIITPTLDLPSETPTPDKDEVAFAAWILSDIFHGIGESDIANAILILGADPVPVEGAAVTLTMTRPDGSSETLTGVTDAAGVVEIVFDIFVFGNYLITIDDIAAEGYVYAPERNVATEFVVQVGSAETRAIPADRVVAFYEGFNQEIADGDAAHLFETLHPAVLERYGEEACRTRLEEVVLNPLVVEVLELVDFGVWTYDQDEVLVDIEHTYSVEVRLALPDGSTVEQEAHVALRDDASVGWFTDCGEPLE